MFVRLVNDLLGTRIKAIHGYKGQPEEFQAVEKGELDGLFMSGWSGPGRAYVRDRMSRGEMRLLVQMAPEQGSACIPTRPPSSSSSARPTTAQIVQLVLDRMTLGRPFIAPPGVAADRLALLRTRVPRAVEDPELRADAEKSEPRASIRPGATEAEERDQAALPDAAAGGRTHAQDRSGRAGAIAASAYCRFGTSFFTVSIRSGGVA